MIASRIGAVSVRPPALLAFFSRHQPPTPTFDKLINPCRKIAELGNEAAFLRSVLQRFVQSRTRAQREQKEREELLARRYEVGFVGWCWKGHLFIFYPIICWY